MGMRISTNVASMNAQNSMGKTQKTLDKSFAQLSSGNRITKAADDAAGLAMSEGMRGTIKSYQQATRNANDGVSLIQVAEGGLNEISNIMIRLRELGVQAASDTVGDTERGFINKEVVQLKDEAQRIAVSTKFGSQSLLDGSTGDFDFQVGVNNDDFADRISFKAGENIATASELGIEDLDFTTKDGARDSLSTIDTAQTQVNGYRANLGALQNRLFSTTENLGVATENLSAAKSRVSDTDVAMATSDMTKANILLQASTSVLAQANASPNLAMKLIG